MLVVAAIGTGGAAAQDAADKPEKSAYDLGVASYQLAVEEAELREQLNGVRMAGDV